MTSPRLPEEQLGQLYSTYYPRRQVVVANLLAEAKQVGRPAAAFWRWWRGTDNQGQYLAKPGDTLLDVGCGSGLSLLEAKTLGADAYGIEADPNVQRIADELGLTIHIGNLYDRPFPDVKFDLIVLNQVIEHIPEPAKALGELRERLKPGGRIFLAFPNQGALSRRLAGDRWIHWHVPFHINHFDLRHFLSMAERLGYRARRHATVTPNVWAILQLRSINARPKRGIPSPIWHVAEPRETANSHVEEAAEQQPHSRPLPIRLLRKSARVVAINALALGCRLVDGLGQGDSIVVELEPVEKP